METSPKTLPLRYGVPQKPKNTFVAVGTQHLCGTRKSGGNWSLGLYADQNCQFKTDSLQKLSIMSHVIMLLGFNLLAPTQSLSVPTLILNTMRGYMRNVGHVINYHASRD